MQRGSGVPEAINGALALFYVGVYVVQFFVLPLALLPPSLLLEPP